MMLNTKGSLSSIMTVKDYIKSMNSLSEIPAKPRRTSVNFSSAPSFRPKSIIEFLELLEADPVELLLDLGFGKEEPDLCTKIPARFISYPSKSKGINIRVFLQAQKQRLDIESPNLYGRFRQLEILDQVTSVFSSLLNNVNAAQKKLGAKTEENTAENHQNKAKRTRERWRRICQLLRKTSRQTMTYQPSIQDTQVPELCQRYEEQSPDCYKLFEKSRKHFSENRTRSLLGEDQLPSEDNTLKSSQPAKPLRDFMQTPVKQAHLTFQSEIPIRERVWKKAELLLEKTLRKTSGIEGQSPDSFEMEEIQSFDEEIPRGRNTEAVSEAEMTRTSSCQSDSSGFLEEPPEHLPQQNSCLPETFNISSDSQAKLQCSLDFIFSYQDCKYESEDATSSSTMADSEHDFMKATPNTVWDNYGDGKEEEPVPFLPGSCRKGMELDTDQPENSIKAREHVFSCVGTSATGDQVSDLDAVDTVAAKSDCFIPFYVVHTIFQGKEPLNEKVELTCKNLQQQNTQEDEQGKEISPDVYNEALKSVPILGSVWDMDSHHMDRSLARMHSDAPSTPSPVQNMCGNLSTHTKCPSIPSTEDEFESDCVQCKEPPTSKTEISQTQSKVPIQITETSTNFYKSVTIQMSSNLVSGLQNAAFNEYFVKENSYESTSISLRNSEYEEDEEDLTLRFGTQKKRVKDSSIQTDSIGREMENDCAHLKEFFASQSHGFCFPTNATSLDSGSLGKYEVFDNNVQDAWSKKCSHCSHCCCIHHCWALRTCPVTSMQSTPVICCSTHTNIESELLQTLKLLQDSLKTISPCSVHEMERMKNSCQHYREQLVEIEQQLVEQQALSSNALSTEGREESRRLQGLRRAVHQEIAELEFQLDDRIRQLKEGSVMQLEQLLEEQSKLCSELDFFNWREEEKTTSDVSLSSGSTSHLVAECLTTVSSEEESKEIPVDCKERKGLPAQPKMDFSSFLQNLKKSFQNPFGSDTAEVRK
ncbi:protein ITPRID1 [Microcaecilia unicolor]|uniref:Protein ITPRID1 n=1 Tax=Microcaecilia unicolor TaxID=1415580 RepID=A0A6P7YEI7_9AMPH|nr:protein ITPRID1 [Microcaecilia unicolor]